MKAFQNIKWFEEKTRKGKIPLAFFWIEKARAVHKLVLTDKFDGKCEDGPLMPIFSNVGDPQKGCPPADRRSLHRLLGGGRLGHQDCSKIVSKGTRREKRDWACRIHASCCMYLSFPELV
ncbi:Uncharacterized protein Fot_26895 [Forsythia ovata]|uniref:Uncharacterized protein n=1 Tax=Forsythia ovata TaxID=205694 RepID=A0ABD1UD61_9LAMI